MTCVLSTFKIFDLISSRRLSFRGQGRLLQMKVTSEVIHLGEHFLGLERGFFRLRVKVVQGQGRLWKMRATRADLSRSFTRMIAGAHKLAFSFVSEITFFRYVERKVWKNLDFTKSSETGLANHSSVLEASTPYAIDGPFFRYFFSKLVLCKFRSMRETGRRADVDDHIFIMLSQSSFKVWTFCKTFGPTFGKQMNVHLIVAFSVIWLVGVANAQIHRAISQSSYQIKYDTNYTQQLELKNQQLNALKQSANERDFASNGLFQYVRIELVASILGSIVVGLSGIFPVAILPRLADDHHTLRMFHSLDLSSLTRKFRWPFAVRSFVLVKSTVFSCLTAFAAGSLLGDVFIHLMPETYSQIVLGKLSTSTILTLRPGCSGQYVLIFQRAKLWC